MNAVIDEVGWNRGNVEHRYISVVTKIAGYDEKVSVVLVLVDEIRLYFLVGDVENVVFGGEEGR